MPNQNSIHQPLILTLKLDADSFAFFDCLRQKHFPPERNFLRAHVTLFHHLPGEKIETIKTDLRRVAAEYEKFPVRFSAVRFLGKGSAVEIESADLNQLRERLKNEWLDDLTNQDRQKFKPHITVQNKVAPDIARRFFGDFSANFIARNGWGIGIELWRYLNGPWELIEAFEFGSGAEYSKKKLTGYTG